MHLRGIISSKYTDILLGQINGIGLKFKESTLKAIRSEKTGERGRGELFQNNLSGTPVAISATFVANKKRLIYWILKTSSSCHFTLSDIMDGQNG